MNRASLRGPTLHADEVHVWLVDLDLANDEADDTEKHIAPAINRKSPGTRHERLGVSRRCVREILARYLGCRPGNVPVDRGNNARPTLSDAGGLSFSVAHSDVCAVLAVARACRIGIDVERIRDDVRIDDLIRRFFSKREIEQLLSLPPEDREAAFFRVWVRKEAYLKAVGGGVPAGLRRFSVSVALSEPPAILETELEDGGVSAFSLYDIDVPEGYVGALAVEGTGHRIRYLRR